MTNSVSNSFERGFLTTPLEAQIECCDRYELSPLFITLFKDHYPVLEAGCGSGRWNAWLAKQGISSTGLDWSEELCERARMEVPQCRFVAGDMRNMPFEDGEFGGLMALGSVEHMPEGPAGALKEFHRVLKPRGIAVITVPYGGWLRRTRLTLLKPITMLKANVLLRRIFHRQGSEGRSLKVAKQGTTKSWYPIFSCAEEGYFFYEYEFSKKQMRTFLIHNDFEILQEFVGFADEGVLHNFGRLSASWNSANADVDFRFLGKVLRLVISVNIMGHMLCYAVRRVP